MYILVLTQIYDTSRYPKATSQGIRPEWLLLGAAKCCCLGPWQVCVSCEVAMVIVTAPKIIVKFLYLIWNMKTMIFDPIANNLLPLESKLWFERRQSSSNNNILLRVIRISWACNTWCQYPGHAAQICSCLCVGGESAGGAHTFRAAGDGHTAAAADRGSATDACCKGKLHCFVFLQCF